MHLALLVTLTMCAFAGNSLLNRVAVAALGTDPVIFAVIRVAAGAATLAALAFFRGERLPLQGCRRWAGATSLAAYMLGFSWAYINLGAGLGALILFGVVQLVMFGWSALRGQGGPAAVWAGAVISFAGLVVLMWPGVDVHVPLGGAVAMTIAGIGWGVYSLLGRVETTPLAATAANFVLCLPLVLIGLGFNLPAQWTAGGVALAVLAGAVTSGLGYALWYHVLPKLRAGLAAVSQLSVPVIAVLAGVALLGEPLGARMIAAMIMVLGGIGLSVSAKGRSQGASR